MYKYTYLILALVFLTPVIATYIRRPDLRKVILLLSLPGGIAGLIVEYWYFQDYWRPPSLRGVAKVSLEDFLFGIAATCLGAVIYKVVYNIRHAENPYPTRFKLFILYIILGILCMVFFNGTLGINSIFVSSAVSLSASLAIVLLRKDLIIPSLKSGALLAVFAFLVYLLLFDWIAPAYWDKYWLLNNSRYGIKIFGSIPVTELLWYFSWGTLAGTLYEFITGKSLKQI
jgi:hypothetical protein